jgi:hypothetical protein
MAKPKTVTTPPQLLRQRQPVIKEMARELRISRWHAYGLLTPEGYRDAIPAELFDTRSDLAERVASYIGLPVNEVRDFYAVAKAA